MNMIPRAVALTLSVCFLLTGWTDLAAKDARPTGIFSNPSEMKATLTGPWRVIKRNLKKDALYPVQLTYTGDDGQQHTINAKASPRGLTRRVRVCKFPPLKLHFDKEKTKGTAFRGNKSLKLVTYCDLNSKYQQYYVKEFLAYRIYNLITEYSFRVKPLILEYEDSDKSGDSVTRFSFLIEDIDDVAKRNDLEKLNIAKVPYKQLDPGLSSKFALFQYMIGNLDWAATSGPKADSCCHNSRLIGAGETVDPKYGIPYDFDSSGLVNAHYAAPPEGLKVRSITQRLYRGFCPFNETLPEAIGLFNAKKADILALFASNPHLSKRNKARALDYISDFYAILNDPKRLGKEITGKCRG